MFFETSFTTKNNRGKWKKFLSFFKNNVQFQFCSIRYHYFSWRMKNCFKGKPDQLSMLKHNFWRIKKGKIIWISEVIKMYSFCHSVKLFCLLKSASDQTFFVKTQLIILNLNNIFKLCLEKCYVSSFNEKIDIWRKQTFISFVCKEFQN